MSHSALERQELVYTVNFQCLGSNFQQKDYTQKTLHLFFVSSCFFFRIWNLFVSVTCPHYGYLFFIFMVCHVPFCFFVLWKLSIWVSRRCQYPFAFFGTTQKTCVLSCLFKQRLFFFNFETETHYEQANPLYVPHSVFLGTYFDININIRSSHDYGCSFYC